MKYYESCGMARIVSGMAWVVCKRWVDREPEVASGYIA